MEEYDSNCVKSEKAGAILLYNNLKCVAKLFRIVEIGFVVVFLSWSFSRLPFAVKISGDYFRQLISVMVSPLFTFIVCNAIVLTLLLKAGHILVAQSPAAAGEIDSGVYEGFIKTSDDCSDFTNDVPPPVSDPVEVEYQDKEMIFEESIASVSTEYFNSPVDYETPLKISQDEVYDVPEFKPKNTPPSELKDFKRSLSENLKTENIMEEEEDYNYKAEEESHPKLRRSETEKWRKVSNPGEIPEETVYVFDELSNEEFQRTIEAFIEKQIQFHQEEKLAIVLSSSSSSHV